ncbi:hypothetical protein [Bradyrhizobium cenepequi]|uniref:hypothetical protein n=1 Tax=Bradyrhizobium cenepequi TaxID=2821403 RepID=UPI001CE2499B|nr:hypothetical protein [Bradyrhizobium cenepequi]
MRRAAKGTALLEPIGGFSGRQWTMLDLGAAGSRSGVGGHQCKLTSFQNHLMIAPKLVASFASKQTVTLRTKYSWGELDCISAFCQRQDERFTSLLQKNGKFLERSTWEKRSDTTELAVPSSR